MITLYPYASLGHADHGWLDARHHFSFADYRNPDRVQFGPLRVINDDIIAAGTGFGEHPHDNMEIITYVREGAITHKDSLGNTGRTAAGDVQVMSAGTGVRHAEFNLENGPTRLYQIWIKPQARDVAPRWDAREFPKEPVTGALPLLVSGRARDKDKGALFIHQDAAIYGGKVNVGDVINQPVGAKAYILASEGQFSVNGTDMNPGDGAEVMGQQVLNITATTDAEILVIDLPD
ncbi:MAG: pirin family protein [Alphaproteobacteria bacterium]|nr:pirin family protein [Alphaproteobacteria bacterium]